MQEEYDGRYFAFFLYYACKHRLKGLSIVTIAASGYCPALGMGSIPAFVEYANIFNGVSEIILIGLLFLSAQMGPGMEKK